MFGKVIWELYEFIGDRLVSSNMQLWKNGGLAALTDTMHDIGFGLLGALLISLPAWWQLRKNPSLFYRRFIRPYLCTTDDNHKHI